MNRFNIKKKNPIILDTAVLEIKAKQELDFINNSFDKVILDNNNCIRIDFGNGNIFMENNFPNNKNAIFKLYLEFFDLEYQNDIMDYLIKDSSNFRATSSDGTIVRPSIEDYNYVMEHSKKKIKRRKRIL